MEGLKWPVVVFEVCCCIRAQGGLWGWQMYIATPWTVARQAPLSLEFSRQEYWSGLPFSSPRDLPDPGIKPGSPALQAHSLLFETPGKPI